MAERPAAEKTEQPTPRRLVKAREKGKAAESRELPAAFCVSALVLVLAFRAGRLLDWFVLQMREGMGCRTDMFSDSETFVCFVNGKIEAAIAVMSPIFVILFLSSVLASVAVSGLNFAPQAVNFKWNAVNPLEGFRKLVDSRSVVRVCISVAKLVFVSLIVWFYFSSRIETLLSLRWAWSGQIVEVIGKVILGVMIRICAGLVVIGLIDAAYQRWKHTQELKMTKQEVKDERRDTEGLPEVKSHIRRVQIEMARQRMLQEVPKANVVLVNPTHVAVALRYEAKTMDAPVVVAKGAGLVAEKIRELARAYGVPVIRRPELARTIYSTVERGAMIPESLYVVVAEILALIHRMRQRG